MSEGHGYFDGDRQRETIRAFEGHLPADAVLVPAAAIALGRLTIFVMPDGRLGSAMEFFAEDAFGPHDLADLMEVTAHELRHGKKPTQN